MSRSRGFATRAVAILFIALSLFSTVAPEKAEAQGRGCDGWYGRGCWVGFFTGLNDPNYAGANVIENGLNLADNDRAGFISQIKGHLAGGSQQNRTGAQFIIATMIGQPAGTDRNITPAELADWESRVMAPGVYMRVSYQMFQCNIANTYYDPSRIDVAAGYSDSPDCGKPDIMIDFFVDGTFYYRIRAVCANPLGNPNALPPPPPPPTAGPADFIPSVQGNPEVISVGQTYQFTFTIQNSSAYNGSANYTISVTPPGGVVSTGSSGVMAGGTIMNPPPYNGTATDSSGDQICATLSIDGSPNTAQDCIVIGKKPLFQVWGGDVWAGGSYASGGGSTCPVDAASPGRITGVGGSVGGSWGEYGVFALNKIDGFGSAAQPRFAGQPATKLTFANTNASALGYYYGNPTPANGRCLTDMFSQFGGGGAPLPPGGDNLTSLSSGTYTTGNVTLRAPGPIEPGRKIVIVSTGTVRLDANPSDNGIRYRNDGITSISELPQLVILAQNIVINNQVSQVDAWLAARNTVFTCETPKPLSKTSCNNPLTINGPVIADRIVMNRTAGGEQAAANQPGEKFNLRPDVFLQAYADRGAATQIRTIRQQELPARY